MSKRRVIIDTDPGIDDALAILLALASTELEVDALTVVYGNCSVDQGVENSLGILELAQATRVPVARGCALPLVQPLLLASETHGNNGLGYARLPAASKTPVSQTAVSTLIERIMASPGEITLISVGPLTNLAMAVRLEPGIIDSVKEVFIMGGAIAHPGNTTPLAEFNVYCDPHAAHIVFHSGLPITLFPLDVTYQVILTQGDVDRLSAIPSPITRFIVDSTRFYMEFHEAFQEIRGCVINDPLVLAAILCPEVYSTKKLFVDVDINGGISMGKTFADFYRMHDRQPNMKVALDVQPRQFIDFFLERMEVLAKQISM
jgi:purine nucleosidase